MVTRKPTHNEFIDNAHRCLESFVRKANIVCNEIFRNIDSPAYDEIIQRLNAERVGLLRLRNQQNVPLSTFQEATNLIKGDMQSFFDYVEGLPKDMREQQGFYEALGEMKSLQNKFDILTNLKHPKKARDEGRKL